jgi:hypothetical protein
VELEPKCKYLCENIMQRASRSSHTFIAHGAAFLRLFFTWQQKRGEEYKNEKYSFYGCNELLS